LIIHHELVKGFDQVKQLHRAQFNFYRFSVIAGGCVALGCPVRWGEDARIDRQFEFTGGFWGELDGNSLASMSFFCNRVNATQEKLGLFMD
jgi:hypothetical protein